MRKTKTKGTSRRKPHAPHWYFIETEECVICMKQSVYRERRYGKKPQDPSECYAFRQYACDWHFM